MNNRRTGAPSLLPPAFALALALVGLLASPCAFSAVTDIAQVPLVTSANTTVKPNIMFVLDDSGSMASNYMPDDANFNALTKYGLLASQCNGLAYNPDPAVTYDLPVSSTGSTIAAGTDAFTLANATQYYYTYSGVQPKLSYKYSASGVDKTTTFYKECNSAVNAAPGNAVFTLVNITSGSADAAKYQRWYTFYRTRINMMKSAMSLAFNPIGDKYRVGFTTISSNTAKPGTKFLDINTFDATHKTAFYTALNAATPGSNTPLRGALSKAGQYFANKAVNQASDPIQYACQKNFTILSTDGYWNTGTETGTYSALDVAGAYVGNRDGTEDRPMRDASGSTTTTVTTWKMTARTTTETDIKTTSFAAPSTIVTTVYTPTSGSTTTSYALGTLYTAKTNSAMAQTCVANAGKQDCTVTVTTSTTHGYAVGNPVTTTAISPYGGTWSVTAVTSNTYKYVITGLSSVPVLPATAANRGTSLYSPVGCPSGQGQLTKTATETDLFRRDVNTTINGQAIDTTKRTLTQTDIVTPHSRTVVVTNGVQISDTVDVAGAPGSPSTIALPALADLVVGPYTYTAVVSNVPTNNVTPPGYTPTTTTTISCAATKPANSTGPVSPTSPTLTPAPTTSSTADIVAAPVVTPTPSGPFSDVPVVTPTTVAVNGSDNSLADVAEYYYKTDLRNATLSNCQGALGVGTDVCGAGTLNALQSMITFTIGLGTSGTLQYDKNYQKQVSGDFFDVKQGTKQWPNPTISSGGGDPTNIDDLWHAAVNGRGRYFSAGDPNEVVSSLSSALLDITAIVGSSSAAATSTLQPVQGDDDVYAAQFTSGKWTGKLYDYKIDPKTGVVDKTIDATHGWEAGAVLDARILSGASPRKIYYFRPGAGFAGTLQPFTYANLSADAKNGLFDNFCSKAGAGGGASPDQCLTLDAAGKTAANLGTNLVSYIAGAKNDAVYRARDSALGDIVNAAPIFVGLPKFKYTENAYSTYIASQTAAFKAATPEIKGVVYVAANDGMLHAFDRVTGDEKWAYIPTMVMPNLYKLADNAYVANHQFYVDGSPIMGDIFVGGAWKTILVGGLGGGGRGYYALDITDPNNPKALWEFTDNNLGLTYGNPVITKRTDGTWVVAFGSGYNNVSPGDGNGRLYVVNANTGASVATLPTYTSGSIAAGSVGTPSGMAKINAWVDSDIDNTARVYYGGDLLGNVWRFDIDGQALPSNSSYLLAQLSVGGVAQPITTKPQLAEVTYNGSKFKVAYVGTGRYMGTADLSNTDLQSVYALKDTWTASSGLGNAHTSTSIVEQTLANGGAADFRTASTNPVDWSTKNGWRVDFSLSPGERVNVNMSLSLNVLTVATNIPTPSACDAGGQSWLYKFDVGSGTALTNAKDHAVAISLGNVLVAGLTVAQLTDGQSVTITTLSNGDLRTDAYTAPSAGGTLKRTSWRELAN